MDVIFRRRRHEERDRLQWDWVLSSRNGEPLARSTESYDNKSEAISCFEMTTGQRVPTESETAMVAAGALPDDELADRLINVSWELSE